MKNLKFSFLSTLIIAFCFGLTAAYADMAETINKAGKQRMLTQKMSKEVLLIAKGVDAEKNQANLKATTDLFDSTLKALLDANEDEKIEQQLNTVAGLWKTFSQNVTGDTSSAVLVKLAEQNMPLLKEMNAAVKMYEKASGSSLAPGLAVTINLAGKQRMLTQKMTKELLLVANGIDADNNKANLKKTVALFGRTLNGLFNGDPELGLPGTTDEAIVAQLQLVKKLWEQYKPILISIDVSPEGLVQAAELNMPLLKEMNKAVGMYANSVK